MVRDIIDIFLIVILCLAFLAPFIGYVLDYKRDKKLFIKGLKDAAGMLLHFFGRMFR